MLLHGPPPFLEEQCVQSKRWTRLRKVDGQQEVQKSVSTTDPVNSFYITECIHGTMMENICMLISMI